MCACKYEIENMNEQMFLIKALTFSCSGFCLSLKLKFSLGNITDARLSLLHQIFSICGDTKKHELAC